jgi:hypothetical protein
MCHNYPMRTKKFYASYLHIVKVMIITAFWVFVCVWGRSGQSSPVAWQDLCPAELQLHHHAEPPPRLPETTSCRLCFLCRVFFPPSHLFSGRDMNFFASYSCKARNWDCKVLSSLRTLQITNGHLTKGSLTRDFRLQAIFMNQFTPDPWVFH